MNRVFTKETIQMANEKVLNIFHHLGITNENYEIPPVGLKKQHCHVIGEGAELELFPLLVR